MMKPPVSKLKSVQPVRSRPSCYFNGLPQKSMTDYLNPSAYYLLRALCAIINRVLNISLYTLLSTAEISTCGFAVRPKLPSAFACQTTFPLLHYSRVTNIQLDHPLVLLRRRCHRTLFLLRTGLLIRIRLDSKVCLPLAQPAQCVGN